MPDCDPFGRRIQKVHNNQTTWYLYSDQGLIAEFDQTHTLKRTYGWQPNQPWGTDPLWLADITLDPNTNETLWTLHYFHNDHLGTPQLLTNKDGNVTWKATYESFGKANVDPASTVSNPLRFPGQFYDSETGTHYNYFRDYDPLHGGYIQSDLVGILRDYSDPTLQAAISVGSLQKTEFANEELNHLYRYVGGNPLYWFDPYGLAEHTQNRRESNREAHEEGQSRRQSDQGGEKADSNRKPHRKKPKGWKGVWPPKKGLFFPCLTTVDCFCIQNPEQCCELFAEHCDFEPEPECK